MRPPRARIRRPAPEAGVTATGRNRIRDDPTTPEDRALLRQRADLLDPVVARLTRRVKRALQDDQNRVLDKIRSGSGQWTTEALGSEEEQAALLVEASSRLLKDAYLAGAALRPRARDAPGAFTSRACGRPEDRRSRRLPWPASWPAR